MKSQSARFSQLQNTLVGVLHILTPQWNQPGDHGQWGWMVGHKTPACRGSEYRLWCQMSVEETSENIERQ